MNITAKTKIAMVIGDPIEHSLSPKMHNAGLENLALDSTHVYVGCRVNIADLENFVKGVKAMKIHFVSCTIPHKIEIIKYLDEIDDVAKKIGAVNTVINNDGILKGSNTDWLGVLLPLEKKVALQNKTVALLGAGGAARAAAYAVTSKGATLKIYNRTLENAKVLAEAFGGEAYSLELLQDVRNADIIINTTAIGMQPNIHETPLPKEFINNNQIVFDAVYTPYETTFLREAKEQGASIIHGTEMFLQQGITQFKLYTGKEAPEEVMRNILLDNFKLL